MIKANELRIGNWVDASNTHHGEYGRIAEINTYSVGITRDGQYSTNGVYCTELEAILLTPEILRACGFMVDGYDNYASWQASKKCTNFRIDMDSGFFVLLCNYGKQNHLIPLETSVQSLHQLQNLYFALTGDEIKVFPYEMILNSGIGKTNLPR